MLTTKGAKASSSSAMESLLRHASSSLKLEAKRSITRSVTSLRTSFNTSPSKSSSLMNNQTKHCHAMRATHPIRSQTEGRTHASIPTQATPKGKLLSLKTLFKGRKGSNASSRYSPRSYVTGRSAYLALMTHKNINPLITL